MKREKIAVTYGAGFIDHYVEDCAEAIVIATKKYNKPDSINMGAGFEISIKNLVELIVKLTGFKGKIMWDTTKPDGLPR